jgi:MFS family permease
MITEPNLPVPIISIALGALLLLFGRKLFWLFVAAIGFAVGLTIAPHLAHDPPPWLTLALGLLLGIVGALIAFLLQKVAIGVAGFLAGGRLAVLFAGAFLANQANYYWVAFVVGGIVGAILLLALFDWALVVLSSAEGAHLISESVRFPERGAAILFIVLFAAGIVIQTLMMRRRS